MSRDARAPICPVVVAGNRISQLPASLRFGQIHGKMTATTPISPTTWSSLDQSHLEMVSTIMKLV